MYMNVFMVGPHLQQGCGGVLLRESVCEFVRLDVYAYVFVVGVILILN